MADPTKNKKTRNKAVKLTQPAAVEEVILPCPFCGSKAECYVSPWGTGVKCTSKSCMADGPTPDKLNSKRSAVLAWNKRA